MPRNGAGVYSLVNNTWFPPVNGVLATSTDWTPFITDVQNALTQSVSSDGQTPMTGNLPMGNNKITGLANGTAATDAVAFGQIAQAFGQCQLSKSGSNLILLPYNGNKLFINGVMCTVPAAGVTLGTGSLAASTVYNIYAVATGTMVSSLEASTTARATDATYGNQIKTGDATRALVGKARTTSGTAWADTDAQRFVINWFNQKARRIYNIAGSPAATTSGTPVPLIPFMEFICWGDTDLPVSFCGNCQNNTINAANSMAMAIDSSTAFSQSPAIFQAYAANANGPAVGGTTFIPTEGYHFVYTLGQTSGGSTGTWATGFEHSGTIQG